MKKKIILTGIIMMTLVSCSTDEAPAYNEKSNKTNVINETDSYFGKSIKDTIYRTNDSINGSVNPKPIKP